MLAKLVFSLRQEERRQVRKPIFGAVFRQSRQCVGGRTTGSCSDFKNANRTVGRCCRSHTLAQFLDKRIRIPRPRLIAIDLLQQVVRFVVEQQFQSVQFAAKDLFQLLAADLEQPQVRVNVRELSQRFTPLGVNIQLGERVDTGRQSPPEVVVLLGLSILCESVHTRGEQRTMAFNQLATLDQLFDVDHFAGDQVEAHPAQAIH